MIIEQTCEEPPTSPYYRCNIILGNLRRGRHYLSTSTPDSTQSACSWKISIKNIIKTIRMINNR